MIEEEQELERDLGLWSVVAISTGAMIGSGIFILPGIAMAEAGPAVILAFVLAAILVLPAAVSIAELGTAMPEAGGDYIFIERGMGPAAGTIAGLGTWLMLMFKGALALVGGMFYLLAVAPQLPSAEAVAVTIGLILIAVNIFGVKQTGGLQTIMVAVMLLILGAFVALSITSVENQHYEPFFDGGTVGLLTATATVLISYGGVTKVAAVAEEIDNPGRNLPLGLLLSLGVTTLLYALIVFVLVGIVEAEQLEGSNIPMVDAVEPFFGFGGVVLIVLAAMLALISTANAGILTASRYPFALSRDRLLPEAFGYVNDRLHTPVTAILITGGAMLVIILTLPVEEIAKTAGAFQIVVYVLVNVALIAFRTRNPAWYDPEFLSPAYPWIQLFGIVSGVGILTQMDTLPLVGGVGIVIFGFIWYMLYGRPRVDREGVIGEAVAETIDATPDDEKPYRIVVPIARPVKQRSLLKLAVASASAHDDAEIIAVNVITVPDQTSLAQEVEFEQERIERQQSLLDEARGIAEELGVGLRTHAVVGRNVSDAILDVIEDEQADEVLIGWKGKRQRRDVILGSIIDPIVEHAPCDVSLVKHLHDSIGDTVAFVGAGPYSSATVERAANLVHSEEGATLTLVNVQATPSEADEDVESRGYELIEETAAAAGLDSSQYTAKVIVADDIEETLLSVADEYKTVCIGASRSSSVGRALFGTVPEKIGERASGTVVIVRGDGSRSRSIRAAISNRLSPKRRSE